MMKIIILQVLLTFLVLPISSGSSVKGSLSFMRNGDSIPVVNGKVSIGIVADERDAFLSATLDVLSSKRIKPVDTNGVYEFEDLPANVDLLLMAGRSGVSEPTLIKRVNLDLGEERVVNFVFPAESGSPELSLIGSIKIDGKVPSEVVAGSVTVTSQDESIASIAMFGSINNGAYQFFNLPHGVYYMVVGYEDNQGGITVDSDVVVIVEGQVIERDVDLMTQ